MHCEKSVCIRIYSGPYSVWTRENTDQNNFEYRHFLPSNVKGNSSTPEGLYWSKHKTKVVIIWFQFVTMKFQPAQAGEILL